MISGRRLPVGQRDDAERRFHRRSVRADHEGADPDRLGGGAEHDQDRVLEPVDALALEIVARQQDGRRRADQVLYGAWRGERSSEGVNVGALILLIFTFFLVVSQSGSVTTPAGPA
jgi:hypothetical protein